VGQENFRRATVRVSDPSQLGSLQELLSWAVPGGRVSRVPGQPGPGEQGALDVLAAVTTAATAQITDIRKVERAIAADAQNQAAGLFRSAVAQSVLFTAVAIIAAVLGLALAGLTGRLATALRPGRNREGTHAAPGPSESRHPQPGTGDSTQQLARPKDA
jgi:hypothetical protein